MVSFKVFRGSNDGIKEGTSEHAIGADEVLVKVTHSGLCGTDVHYLQADMVLGHEGVGTVEDMGEKVTLFKKGQRVGWGYIHNSCGECKQCLLGREQYCLDNEKYGTDNHDQGSFATYSVRKERFLFAVPDEMTMAVAAPLMCGGATVFTALHDYGVKASDRVGIVGVGGLGHLAIQFAAKMGCEVVVFSGTESKKAEATKLGAREFYATKGVDDLAKLVERRMDHLIVTTGSQPDWTQYLSIMEPEGTIYPLTVSQENLSVPYMTLIMNGIRVQGMAVASRQTQKEMLRFAAVHGIKPIVQEFPMTLEGVKEAFKTLNEGKMRYRGVLVVD